MHSQIRHLEIALDSAQVGTWSWEVGSGVLTWDDRMRALYGIPDREPVSYDVYIQRVHPDDGVNFFNTMRELAETEADGRSSVETIKQDFRIIHPELGERWISAVGRIERDEYGQARTVSGINIDVTDRMAAENKLRASEERYRNLNRSMLDGFVAVDMNGRITESNRAFQEMVGYSEQELEKLTYQELTPEKWHAFEQELVETQILPEGHSELYEKEYITKNGLVISVELRTCLIRNAVGDPKSMWAIVRDISARKRAEQTISNLNATLEQKVAARTLELQQSEARFRQLTNATFEGCVVSEAGIILDGNPQLVEMFGYEITELIGRPLIDFVAPDSRELVAERVSLDWEEAYEFRGLKKDGSTFPAESHARIGTWNGKRTRITALRDLTAYKEIEEKLQSQRTKLDQATRLALVSEVSAGIIHQIGQPICVIGAILASIPDKTERGGKSCDELRQCLKLIKEETDRMRDSVRHLRTLTDTSKKPDSLINANDVINGVAPLLRQESENRNMALTVDLDPDLPAVLGNSVQLSQVVINLTRNALDACIDCPPERRIIEVSTRKSTEKEVELLVRDAGAGIAPDVLDQLFTPLFTTKHEGLGIGLSLSETIIRAHGGTIKGFNNPDGNGSIFQVLIPTT